MSSHSTLQTEVSGLRIVNGTAQVTPADLWHLGSNTKAMTAALAGVLVQRGQISWDTTLANVLPNLPGVLPVYESATLEEFLRDYVLHSKSGVQSSRSQGGHLD